MLPILLVRKYFFSPRSGSLIRTIGWISFAGIFLGVFALILVMSVMAGFNSTLKQRLLNVEPHLVVKSATVAQVQAALAGQFRSEIFEYDVQDAVVRNEEGVSGGAVIKGFPQERLEQILTYQQTSVPLSRFMPQAGEVIVGRDLAVGLGVYEGSELLVVPPEALLMPVGTNLQFEKVKVRALFETGVNDVDGKYIFYVRGKALSSFADSNSREQGSEVIFAQPNDADKAQQILKERNMASETWGDRNTSILKALKLERTMVGLFVALSALIASFSIVGVISLLLTQKRQDLGVLMALGLSRKSVSQLYSRVGFLLSGSAILGGVTVALGVCWLLNKYPVEVLPAIYQDRTIPAQVNYTFVAVVLASALLLAWLASTLSVKVNLRGRWPVELLRRR